VPDQPRLGPLALLLAALAAPTTPSRAAEMVFAIDPERSTLQFAGSSQAVLPLPQNFSGYGFGNRTMPYQAPLPGTPGLLPDGSTSDGLRTAITGLVRTDFADPPTQIRVVRDLTSLILGPSGAWTPGLPNLPGVAAPANLALRFGDPTLDWTWSAALRDWVLSLSTEGAPTALAPAGADTWTFAAGCTPPAIGCPVFRVENAQIDSADTRGFLARSGYRSGQDPIANPPATQGTLARLPGGKWELTVPIALAIAIDGLELYDPLGIDHGVSFTGQIVAVPEPGGAAGAAAIALLALARRRAARHLRGAAALAVAMLPALGCFVEFDPDLNKTSFTAPIRCTQEWLRVYEIVNNNPILIGGGEIQNPTCNANGITLNGSISGGIGFQALNTAYSEYGSRGSRLAVGSTWNLAADSSIPLKIDYRARFEIDYPASTVDRPDPPQLYYYAWDYGLGTTAGSTQTGTISVNGVPTGADWMVRTGALNGAGGTAVVDLALEAYRSGLGKEYQGVMMMLGVQPHSPKTNLDCRRVFGDEFQFRVRSLTDEIFCSPGTASYACTHSSQCRLGNECYDGICRKQRFQVQFLF
jgi:hypothetical protein